MSEFTFQANNTTKLESLEWDNIWWETTQDEDTPRVLYIGDSISCGTRRTATVSSSKTLLFDGFGTSKALDNPYFAKSISLFAVQQKKRCAVLFNNGLHGWHLDDETEYKHYYELMILFLMQEFSDSPLFLLLSTHVTNDETDKRVQARNRVVCELAEKYGLEVIDLYSVVKENKSLICSDGVHLTDEGYKLLANEIIAHLSDISHK